MKRALITGIGGQDGTFLAEHLHSLGYEVHGLIRGRHFFYQNLMDMDKDVLSALTFHTGDVRDGLSIEQAIRRSAPHEIYNLAGQVYVPSSWTQPEETFDINVNGFVRIMLALEKLDTTKSTRVYQASTSEMYGNECMPADEHSPMKPVSPYGVSKHAAHQLCRVYRERGWFVCSGILFNHESERRGYQMVTRKITRAIAKWLVLKDKSVLHLGNPDGTRDWGFAGDYVKAMHAMMQVAVPDDYVVGTGVSHTVMNFYNAATRCAYESPLAQGLGLTGSVAWNAPSDIRPNELKCLTANFSKAANELNWHPETTFNQLVRRMLHADIARLQRNTTNESKHEVNVSVGG